MLLFIILSLIQLLHVISRWNYESSEREKHLLWSFSSFCHFSSPSRVTLSYQITSECFKWRCISDVKYFTKLCTADTSSTCTCSCHKCPMLQPVKNEIIHINGNTRKDTYSALCTIYFKWWRSSLLCSKVCRWTQCMETLILHSRNQLTVP